MSEQYHTASTRPSTLEEETRITIEEARMVLPGIQALFGFQLIAVFNSRFQDLLVVEQYLHVVALVLVALSAACIMTPAAYHRIAERGNVSRHFVDLASGFLAGAMLPLMLGISIELFLVSRLVTKNVVGSVGVAAILFLIFLVLWFIFPWKDRVAHKQHLLPGAKKGSENLNSSP